jgi:c-di-GMP-related signal transduction protein
LGHGRKEINGQIKLWGHGKREANHTHSPIYIEESTTVAARISGQDGIDSEVQQRGKGIKCIPEHILIKLFWCILHKQKIIIIAEPSRQVLNTLLHAMRALLWTKK